MTSRDDRDDFPHPGCSPDKASGTRIFLATTNARQHSNIRDFVGK